jgi:[acyl-carrier-protein] S-malonyltransferase
MLNFNIAVVFPGQGSQSVGMLQQYCDDWPQVEQTFGQASKVLGYDLWDIVRNGPEEKLNQATTAQLAMLAADVSVIRIMSEQCMMKPYALAGHSLGEYAALVGANVLDFSDAVSLVATRGQLMQDAVSLDKCALAEVVGLYDEQIIKYCHKASEESGQVVEVTCFNAPGQVVIAGGIAAVDRVIELVQEEETLKRALRLPSNVPAHCSLMKPVADEFAAALQQVEFNAPDIQVIHNVDAKSHDDVDSIRDALVRQLYSPVRWTQIIQIIGEEADAIIECGPGKSLSALTRKINKEMHSYSLATPESMERFLDSMSRE